MNLQIKCVSSLEKIFIDEQFSAIELYKAQTLSNSIYSFQVVVSSGNFDDIDNIAPQCSFKVTTESELDIEFRRVVSMPCTVPFIAKDDNLLRTTAGLYPDLLEDLPAGNRWRISANQWHALWVTVKVPNGCKAGNYPIKINLEDSKAIPYQTIEPQSITFDLEVLPAALPEQKLLRYEWMHYDCIANYYKVDVWSEEHWAIVEKFIANASSHGINTLLTPLWTPPLDTAVGHERLTTQLIDIKVDGSKYSFDFAKLERFVKLALKCNIKRFAMSHAFTQWGATATPKIMADVDGQYQAIFGWDVPATSPEYEKFLASLMPQLLAKFKELKIDDKLFFSISDEPNIDHFNSYKFASELLKKYIGNMPTLDALSNFEFFKNGLVERPAVANNHIEPFVGNVDEMWTYYCISQGVKVPNRFFSMPSARNRIMGVMLYLYKAVGFLHWGFNYYNAQFSLRSIDPFMDTNAEYWVPSGDAFMVYPGADGKPLDSIRHEVFYECLQDLAALQALEEKIGRDAVVSMIQEGVDYTIKMDEYPRSAQWLLDLRSKVDLALV